MAGINFKFSGTNDDVLKKIHQIQNELSKVYNKTNSTKIDLGKDIDFSLLGENFKRLDQQSRDAFNKMSKEAQQYTKDIQSNILALQQVEKMQSGLNALFEEGNPVGIKCALSCMGLIRNRLRLLWSVRPSRSNGKCRG